MEQAKTRHVGVNKKHIRIPYMAALMKNKTKHFKTQVLLVATDSLSETHFTTSMETLLLMFKWVCIVLHA